MSDDAITTIFVVLVLGGIAWMVWRVVFVFLAGVRDGYARKGLTHVTGESPKKLAPVQPVPSQQTSSEPDHGGSSVQSDTDGEQPAIHTPNAIFVSYRREDSSDVTGRIYDRLIAEFGKAAVFKDVDAIPIGVDFRVHLDEAVGKAAVVLAVIGQRWNGVDPSTGKKRLDNSRDFVRIELSAALDRRIPVVPVLVSNATMPAESELPENLSELAYRNAIQVRPDPDFHSDVDRLLRGVKRLFEPVGRS